MAKIAFIQEKLVEKIGTMSISAVLKQHGHKCEVFCKEADENYIQAVIEYNPDVAGCGITTYEQQFAIRTLKRIKQRNDHIITILGGHHATIFTDIINQDCVDIICRGEGEFSVLELMDCLDKKQDYSSTEGLWVKKEEKIFKNPLRSLIQDLASLPDIDRSIYYSKYPLLKNAPTKAFMVSRGCPFQCSFCFNNVYVRIFKDKGAYLRFREPKNVIEEILQVKNKYGLDWVQFHDSTFNSIYDYLNSFMEAYIENGNLPGFICNIRAEGLDEYLISLMKKGKCDKVTIGIQHGKESIRKKLANRGGDQSPEEIIRVCHLLKKYNIRIYTDFIVGWPGETLKDAFESVKISRLINPEGVNSYLLTPFPGTDIQKYSIDHGYMDPETNVEDFPDDLHENKSVINQPNIKKLINMQKLFYLIVYYPKLEPIIRLLLKLPPNKIFTFIHSLPFLTRMLKYDKKTLRSRLKYIIQHTFNIYRLNSRK